MNDDGRAIALMVRAHAFVAWRFRIVERSRCGTFAARLLPQWLSLRRFFDIHLHDQPVAEFVDMSHLALVEKRTAEVAHSVFGRALRRFRWLSSIGRRLDLRVDR